jgi:hypothetical protein
VLPAVLYAAGEQVLGLRTRKEADDCLDPLSLAVLDEESDECVGNLADWGWCPFGEPEKLEIACRIGFRDEYYG